MHLFGKYKMQTRYVCKNLRGAVRSAQIPLHRSTDFETCSTEFYGMALTADETSIYAFGGRRDHSSAPNQVLEYRYGKWKILGSMVENHKKLNSAFQIGNIVYSGYCGLEKNIISDNGVQSKCRTL